MFPLDHVLLPGLPLPLHIFESRYQQMLADIATPHPAFGIVALHRGVETSADVEFAEVGTLAEILEQEPYPDGSCDLLTIGSRRFRVVEVDRSSKPYLQARVEWLSEDDGEMASDLVPMAVAAFGRYSQVLSALSSRERDTDLAEDPLRLSYEIAARVQLPVGQRQRLLAMSSAAERLAACLVMMRREIALIQSTRSVPVAMQALRIRPGSN